MARALALATTHRDTAFEALRKGLVIGCAVALALAGQALPALAH
jgi:hypothetical protein